MAHSIIKTLTVLLFIIYAVFIGTTIPKISEEKEIIEPLTVLVSSITKEEKEEPIGKLIIPKIHLEEEFYPLGSSENTIEKHVTILKDSTSPEEENSILILAAHSGTAGVAYFEHLDELSIQDSIYLNYNQKEYIYEVIDIWEEKKNGYIHINKEETNQLILTTCSPKKEGYQLVINCIKKES